MQLVVVRQRRAACNTLHCLARCTGLLWVKQQMPWQRVALSVLGDKLVPGLVITKHDHLSDEVHLNSQLECHEAGHPVPDAALLAGGQRLFDYVGTIPAASPNRQLRWRRMNWDCRFARHQAIWMVTCLK